MSAPSPRDPSTLPVRWWPLIPIALVGGGLIYLVQGLGYSIVRPARDFTIIVGLINLAAYVWIRAISRLSTRPQITAVGTLLLFQAALLLMFRFDEFAGDGRILFQWRWTRSPEQRLAEFSTTTGDNPSLANLSAVEEADSPAFRGADRTGRYFLPQLDMNWTEHAPRELWRRPVGRGWSSFAIVGEYAITHEQRDDFETVVCYELKSGNEVWQHRNRARFDEATSGAGPRATPTIHVGKVYSFGATGILNCLEGTDGQVSWSRELEKESVPLFGYSSSPLIVGSRLFVTPGGKPGSILALDADTGETIWSRDSRKPGYSSPQLFRTKQMDQILVFDATGLHGYDAETGDICWTFAWGDNSDDQVNVCQPVIVASLVPQSGEEIEAYELLISSGYGRGSALIHVSQGPSGTWKTTAAWHTKTLKSKFSDVVVSEGHAYGLDEGILTCISLVDGSRRWKNGRYGYGQLILINQMLLIQAESGRVVLVEANSQRFVEVASLDVLRERTWNQPVVVGRHLLVRNDREAICLELPVLTAPKATLPK